MDRWAVCYRVHFEIQYLFPKMNVSRIASKDPDRLHSLQVIAKPIAKAIDRLLGNSTSLSIIVTGIKK